jgi:hypothetical protein
VPVLVEAFGEGFAAVMCCYPPSVWWSEDGTRWREIMGLPSEVAYQDVAALGALLRDGRPGTWLLLGDKDHEIGEGGFTGALGTLWTGDGSSWTEVASQPGWEDGRIATDGDIAVVATVKILELDELDRPRLRLDTLASTDGGRSWESSQGEELMPDGCCLGGIALHDDRAFLAGPWGPDSVSLRRADIYGSAP